jgi:hypothetical protein
MVFFRVVYDVKGGLAGTRFTGKKSFPPFKETKDYKMFDPVCT